MLAGADPLMPSVFGFVPSPLNAAGAADMVLNEPPGGLRSVVTPNIQHVALMRHDAAFAAAVREADVCLCDGFPVQLYARSRGVPLSERVAGREVVARIMADPVRLRDHRLLALVDRQDVADALDGWAAANGLADRVLAVVAPLGFGADADAQAAFVETMRAFGPTIALLCLGAPTSELFLHRHRAALPPCWALCIGQSVKIVLGLVPTPPEAMVRLRLEWAWRIALEPRRMIARYVPAAWGFAAAVVRDRRR